ncbi:phosphoenolpyruvate synthase [Oceanidesulfovibrio marinus]|uniref:Phosphoenolpyruvate synthase n=1 Tax=Oceanidesulfovibrio marinus TaxID=370038 RepID=A0A6P1ZD66_9BACT|nr:phosphoenolpyruvate synthase [Oceanidesulfovibrio marinus]TVM31930.1 phosphoenolpyruvate synthase [Oceanidesulfovibrio marinus]
MAEITHVLWFEELGNSDVPRVGGKNASLGEMIRSLSTQGISVPDGFATTADAYREFLEVNGLDEKIRIRLDDYHAGKKSLHKTGVSIRRLFGQASLSAGLESAVREAYRTLSERTGREDTDVAVRSSATAEDLPDASFAGQQESFLNVSGEEELLDSVKRCYASLFTDRAISYREEKGFDHMSVALSVGVQEMVRSDLGCSGVMFSIDTETGFPRAVLINGAWGLGENVVQGAVNPDEFRVFKPLLDDTSLVPIVEKTLGAKEKKMVYARGGSKTTKNINTPKEDRRRFVLEDKEVLTLSRWAVAIEEHYGMPMDMEWAKDGETGELKIVQARPETVQSRRDMGSIRSYSLDQRGEVLAEGLSVGDAVATGMALLLKSPDDIEQFEDGAVLVTEMTDPDWAPIMKRAAAIVTEHGGRTSHAAIVSRELGIPAVVGAEGAMDKIPQGRQITVSCAEGERGYVYDKKLDFRVEELDLSNIPDTKTRIMMNIASPAAAYHWWRLPAKGIGLARMEFVINDVIKAHPMALINIDAVEDEADKRRLRELTRFYDDPAEYFVDQLALGLGKIASSQYPEPVIVRMSDFKTNEYAQLVGGRQFEPEEANPMIGFRGASRYYSPKYAAGFALECLAIRRVRERMGLTNVAVMIPFCRTLEEADRVLTELARNGLVRGKDGLEVLVMAEIPSNVILAEEFAERFDGFSIGSNDLTQLVLGVDRDSGELAPIFDERNEAVKKMIAQLIQVARRKGVKVGICGQAPSDHPEFAAFLVEQGIDSISLNPDSVLLTQRRIAKTEEEMASG